MEQLAQPEKVQRIGLKKAKEQQDDGQRLTSGSEQKTGPCQLVERLPWIERGNGENGQECESPNDIKEQPVKAGACLSKGVLKSLLHHIAGEQAVQRAVHSDGEES